MIIKTISHKRMPFSMMLEYIRDDGGNRNNGQDLEVFSNLSSLDPKDIIQEFQGLYDQRRVRKDGVKFHHIIMSFHPDSTPHLSEDKLSDLAYKFLELRAYNGLAYGALHQSEDHTHFHFMVSNNRVDEPKKSIHLDKMGFYEVRKELEDYQIEKYPELNDSIVLNENKHKNKNITTKPLNGNKGMLETLLAVVFESSGSKDLKSFCENLDQTDGLSVYHYRNKPHGVWYEGKKYRFTTLGFAEKIKILERLDRLRELRESKDLDRDDFHPEQE